MVWLDAAGVSRFHARIEINGDAATIEDLGSKNGTRISGERLAGRVSLRDGDRIDAPIGEDPDKRDYIVSNARIAGTGFKPEWGLDRGIVELIKGFTILRNTIYSNV